MKDEIVSTNPDEIGDFWAKLVYPYAAPIVEANERLEPDPIGSAVRVTFAAKEYLVTAAHVIEGHLQGSGKEQPRGAPYSYIPEQVGIEGEVLSAAGPIDLAIVPLASASRPGLRVPQHFAFDARQGERCLFVGFQGRASSWMIDPSRQVLRPRPLAYMGTVSKPTPERFSIRFNQKQLYRSGTKQNAVGKLNGISGAGVFVLRHDSPRLAGIVIEYQKRVSEIIATSSLALVSMFHSN
ncbi:MAG TPA: hypothetical protein VN682_07440 [Terriglobales bacterium]|nr:hypothetical protein [Terriglobales bacterium]